MKLPLLKRICLLALAALCLGALTGCLPEDPEGEDGVMAPDQLEEVSPPEPEEDPGPVLPEVFCLPYGVGQTLDPITCGDGMQQVAASLLFEGLFRLGPDFEPQACLCESFTREGNRYVFTLREGIAFSDGSPLTGKDVKATLDRAKASVRYDQRLAGISRISAKGNTVTLTLSAPNAALPALLDVPIVKSGSERTQPLGTGPYVYDPEERCLRANPAWWQGGGQPTDRIGLVEASDQDTMLYRFSSHDVQLITADLTGSASVSTTGSVACLDADTTVFQYLGCNTARAPLDDPALRVRLWRSLDREKLISSLYSGHGAPAQFPISPASPLYPNALEFSDAAPIEADAALERPLVLLVNEENRFKAAMARQIAADFTAVGIPAEIHVLPWEAYLEALGKGDFDLYFGEVRLTADWNLTPLLGTKGALNYGRWSDPQTDQLLAEFAAAEDRAGAAERLCARLRSQAPILPVCFKSVSTLVQSSVLEGLTPTAGEPFYNLTDCIIRLRPAE